ncbi:hypothetical protein HGM15179_021233 [Zosterops borbonicus]|uniref:Peptidase A2 domain-containing protein n=1 Tax=Zosterops borbonicus TaxID=364589 RepID=A0A8K1FU90_9PASS|nr:hypothetical protein HGM15179_021233 [Zosterops borbonicus]
MRARYPFKEDLVNSPGKWTTADEVIQYLRELAVLKIIYSDLKSNRVSKDPEDTSCTMAMWRKVVQCAPATQSSSLVSFYHTQIDTPTVEMPSAELLNVEETLGTSTSLQASTSAFRGSPRDHSSPAPVRGKGNPKHRPRGELWFFLHDQAEDMRKWDGEPTFKLEACVRELRGKRAVKKGSPKNVSVLAAETRRQSSISQTIKELKSPPLTLVRGLLVWHRKCQTVSTLMRNRNRRSLSLARRRKGMTRHTTVWIQWPGTSDPQKYKALVDTGAQCTLMPSRHRSAESIWISGVTEGCQELSVLEAKVSFTGE